MTTVKEPPNGSKSPSFFRSVVDDLTKIVIPSSGESHQQDELSPVKKVQRERGTPPKPLPQPQVAPSANDLSNSTLAPSRCEFTFSDGRRCRNQRAQLCGQHALKAKVGRRARSSGLEMPALEALCGDLTTATKINRALAQTFLLMAQGRISRKDAVGFGYLSQLLLQTVSGIRAEYVAAFGYRQWENKLKSSLMPDADDDPEPSPGGDNSESALSSAQTVIPSEQRERGIPQKPLPVNKVHPERGIPPRPLPVNKVHPGRGIPPKPLPVNKDERERRTSPNPPQERPLAERIMGQPDYADILSRSLDMLDRKYDFTPEGRSEAQKLALELELMKPAPAKPAKDFFGQTVDLMRRFRDAEERNAAAGPEPSSLPPEAFLNYYGHPIKLAAPIESGTATPGCAHPTASASRSEPPTVPDPQTRSSGPGDFVAPPSRRHRKPRSHSHAPGCAPHSELPLPLPTTAMPDSVGGPDDEHHEGHRTDWYAPPSWSKTRPPDPCPSRAEKLKRKLRGMSNSAFRRLQHQNSRGFWTKPLQKLTP